MIKKYAAINAILTTLYIALVSSFIFYVPKALGLNNKPDTVFAPILMLSLLVLSVSIVGSLLFGRPIMWYLDGKKKEALSLLINTIVIFSVLVISAFFSLVLFSK